MSATTALRGPIPISEYNGLQHKDDIRFYESAYRTIPHGHGFIEKFGVRM